MFCSFENIDVIAGPRMIRMFQSAANGTMVIVLFDLDNNNKWKEDGTWETNFTNKCNRKYLEKEMLELVKEISGWMSYPEVEKEIKRFSDLKDHDILPTNSVRFIQDD